MEDDYELPDYTIDFVKISKTESLLKITRDTASNILKRPYTTIGQFLKGLNDEDLDILCDIIEDENDPRIYQDILLLTIMLSVSEGIPAKSSKESTENLKYFCTMLHCVSLERKGFVRVFYDNMSFGEDSGERVVVERLRD
jgi:hypothetical protein